MWRASSAPDYMPTLPVGWPSYLDGKVRASPRLDPGERIAVFIVAGQSLAASTAQGNYTPSNPGRALNLNPHDGAVYEAADPLLGCMVREDCPASPFTRVADALVTSGTYDKVILIPCAKGGTSIATWDATLYTWIVGAYRRAMAVGLPITAICWQQGENDAYARTSKAAYLASFRSMRSKVVAAGCDVPWFLAKSTRMVGGGVSAAVRGAIDELVTEAGILAGPDTDNLGSDTRYDDQHWNVAGNAAAAALWTASIQGAF